MAYRWVATSVAGFLQQLAVGYIFNGYYLYLTGAFTEHQVPANTDRKILEGYVADWRTRRGLLLRQAWAGSAKNLATISQGAVAEGVGLRGGLEWRGKDGVEWPVCSQDCQKTSSGG